MAQHIARVELKGDSSAAEYKKLDAEMAKIGFRPIVPAAKTVDNLDVEMPLATYFGASQNDIVITDIRDRVVSAARKVQNKFVVFVALVSDWAWQISGE